ncbi:MAG: hypothetical protein KGZ30_02660 [Anaplasmataceae bacterium]|nr:hypothetical protein [Anaplasmataceae bacterium]
MNAQSVTINRLIFLAGVLAFWTVMFLPQGQIFLGSVRAQGSSSDPDNLALRGYTWSSTTGWMSFCGGDNDPLSCPGNVDYQVYLHNFTGDFSGWAWSPSLGYLSFNRTITKDPPRDDVCRGPISSGSGNHSAEAIGCIDVNTKEGKGWARFLNGCDLVSNPSPSNPPEDSWVCASSGAGAASGGWDGWVRLGGQAQDGTDFAITATPQFRIVSFGWGSEVQGWTSFDTNTNPGTEYVEPENRPTISVVLVARPLPLTRQVPFQVTLEATVTSASNNPIDYEFNCGNEVKIVSQSLSKVEEVTCTYTIPNRYIANVTTTQNGIFSSASASFTMTEEVIALPAGREEFAPEEIPDTIEDIFQNSPLFQ